MAWQRWLVVGLILLCSAPCLRADERALFVGVPTTVAGSLPSSPQIPLDNLPPELREKIKGVIDRPALSTKAPAETFQCDPAMYRWLLEHPHVGVRLWQQVGAKVADIEERNGSYRWHDDQGSEINWHTALRGPGMHLWFAEGKLKPSMLLPLTPFRAVVVLHYYEGKDTSGKSAVRHQVHFLLRCDSRTVSLAARILGVSMPRMTEQYLAQLQMFYGGMAWYLGQDAERARRMFTMLGVVAGQSGNRGEREKK